LDKVKSLKIRGS